MCWKHFTNIMAWIQCSVSTGFLPTKHDFPFPCFHSNPKCLPILFLEGKGPPTTGIGEVILDCFGRGKAGKSCSVGRNLCAHRMLLWIQVYFSGPAKISYNLHAERTEICLRPLGEFVAGWDLNQVFIMPWIPHNILLPKFAFQLITCDKWKEERSGTCCEMPSFPQLLENCALLYLFTASLV